MSILVIAEHNNTTLNPVVLNVVHAASLISDHITLLVAGFNSESVASEAASISGVNKVIHCEAPYYEHGLAENLSLLIAEHVNTASYTHVLAPASFFGKNLMPRVSALLDVQQISDITEIHDSNTYTRPIYAGNALQTVQCNQERKVLTVRPTSFDKATTSESQATIETIEPSEDTNLSGFIKEELTKSERPDLGTANVVVSGGRGLGSAENYEKLILPLADALNAAPGASRAAVDAGWVPNDQQVGQTGKVVAPELYIAIGISGAIQHLAGMKDSKVIVAINKDEEAPIFEVADFGLVADLFDVVPELISSLGGNVEASAA
jgi:electron transfer flavoprotein alpha subunit